MTLRFDCEGNELAPVDFAFDTLVSEIVVSKVHMILSDVLFDRDKTRDKSVSVPLGQSDCTVLRKVMSIEDAILEFAPALRTASQSEAFRIALQMLGDLCGFGLGYFDFDETPGPSAHPERGRPGCGQPEVGSARPGQQPGMAANKS